MHQAFFSDVNKVPSSVDVNCSSFKYNRLAFSYILCCAEYFKVVAIVAVLLLIKLVVLYLAHPLKLKFSASLSPLYTTIDLNHASNFY
jgi:hypothetical protein